MSSISRCFSSSLLIPLGSEAGHDVEPQFAAGDADGISGALAGKSLNCARAVAIAYVTVDYIAQAVGGVDCFLGIDRHENPLPRESEVDKLGSRTERTDIYTADTYLVHFLKMPQKSRITLSSRHGSSLKGVWPVRNTTMSAFS